MHGLTQLWNDTQRGHLSQTDESAFEVGRNVATTEGAVVFENEFFQLLEYAPLTAKIYERPMLFVPPCINKFYILDLQPENSLIRHTVAEGHRVFVMSWKNAGEEIAQRTWDDYIERRPSCAPSTSCRRSPARSRSTRSASASAGRSCRLRWPCSLRAASGRRRA